MSCSNNALEVPKLSRHQCLQKGIGVGLRLPEQRPRPFVALNDEKVYCGQGELPDGYARLGFPHECLQKGVGLGRAMKSRRYFKIRIIKVLFVLVMLIGFVLWLDIAEPDIYAVIQLGLIVLVFALLWSIMRRYNVI